MSIICPCLGSLTGSTAKIKSSYTVCCGSIHNGESHAKTAEQLMRSRYSAYVLQKFDYLLATHHTDYHSINERQELENNAKNTQWLGLMIHEHKRLDPEKAIVEFSAFFTQSTDSSDRHYEQIHERSSFILIADRWFYTEGEFMPAFELSKNQSCFCNSGKKFKRCHGR